MGRKKIEIAKIKNIRDRAVKIGHQSTFLKRQVGLLKKTTELSVLCGVQAYLIYSDLEDNVYLLDPTLNKSAFGEGSLLKRIFSENFVRIGVESVASSKKSIHSIDLEERKKAAKEKKQNLKSRPESCSPKEFQKSDLPILRDQEVLEVSFARFLIRKSKPV